MKPGTHVRRSFITGPLHGEVVTDGDGLFVRRDDTGDLEDTVGWYPVDDDCDGAPAGYDGDGDGHRTPDGGEAHREANETWWKGDYDREGCILAHEGAHGGDSRGYVATSFDEWKFQEGDPDYEDNRDALHRGLPRLDDCDDMPGCSRLPPEIAAEFLRVVELLPPDHRDCDDADEVGCFGCGEEVDDDGGCPTVGCDRGDGWPNDCDGEFDMPDVVDWDPSKPADARGSEFTFPIVTGNPRIGEVRFCLGPTPDDDCDGKPHPRRCPACASGLGCTWHGDAGDEDCDGPAAGPDFLAELLGDDDARAP